MKRFLVVLALGILSSPQLLALDLTHSPADQAVLETPRPTITVYLPITSQLSPREAKLWINGEEVSSHCQRTQAFINYVPPADLPAGNCTVHFTLKDYDQTWTFVVKPRTIIKSVKIDAPANLREFDQLSVELEAPPAQQCWYEVDGVSGAQPVHEDSPGIYRGTFTVPPGYPKLSLRVTGYLRTPRGLETRQSSPVKITAGGFRIKIDEPQSETITGDLQVIKGQTRPGVEIRYQAQLIFRDGIETGPLPKAKWETVRSDEKGGFTIEYKKPSKLPRLDLMVTLSAEDAEGNRSQPIGLHLHYDDSQPLYNPIKVTP